MKYTRRNVLRNASALAVCSAVGRFGTVSAVPVDHSLFNGRGLWTWIPRQIAEDDAEQDRFFNKAAAHEIGTLYAHYDAVDELEDPLAAAPDADIEALLRRCHANGIEVHPMIGGGVAGWPAPDVYPHAEQAVAWNQNHPADESFDGIHVDVEKGTWQQIRDDLFDRFDGYPDDLTLSMAQRPSWIRHNSIEDLRTLMEHRNLDYYCTMVYDLNWATFWPNFGRTVQPWNTPYVLGQGGNEHGHPARNWSDADKMYSWVEENFVTGEPPTKYQYVTETTNDMYIGFSLHSYWALIPPARGETIGAPSRDYQTDPSGGNGGGGGNTAPTASVTASSTTVTTGETVTFDASGSSDSDGSIARYEWDFTSDGTVDASGQTVIHSYTSVGDYIVILTVTDDAGATASATTTISVQSEGGGGTDCSGVPEWDPSATYFGGDRVIYNSALWEAEWWTQSEPTESRAVWTKIGNC